MIEPHEGLTLLGGHMKLIWAVLKNFIILQNLLRRFAGMWSSAKECSQSNVTLLIIKIRYWELFWDEDCKIC